VPFVTSANSAGEEVCIFNFGQDSSFVGAVTAQGNSDDNGVGDFYYSPPSGFLALASSNLPEPAIIDGNQNFNTVLYTGDASTSRAISGVGFSPDWLWIKNRSNTYSHMIYDVVRGAGKYISADNTGAEATGSHMNSFDSDGFTVSYATSNRTNANGNTYVAWNWLAGTAFSNDASATSVGTIDSSGQVNTTAGFSIISYVGSNSNQTVAHGLSSAPELIITKDRDDSRSWTVGESMNGWGKYLTLDTTAASASLTTIWNNTAPTSTVFSLGAHNRANYNGSNFIAYCFHSVEGYSKVGSFSGNNSSNGTFVYTGFRPAWVIVKASNKTENWFIFDNKRDTFNVADHRQVVNTTGAESDTLDTLDFLSNGIKFRTNNTAFNGSYEYIYLAFAESPFKFANAR